jgi:serine phosphatase RsbU (regulator of sigma subunit)/predicted PurR-regulated permease PerM
VLCVVSALWAAPVLSAQELSTEASGLFFENPRFLVDESAYFPLALTGDDNLYVIYQEVTAHGQGAGGEIHISVAVSELGRNWSYRRRVVGPIEYDRESPPVVFTAEIAENGDIYLALVESATRTRILVSSNEGRSFRETATLETEVTSVAPKLSVSSDGQLLLFVNQNVGATQSILYSYSPEGRQWTEFDELVGDPDIGFNFLPDHATLNNRDYVVFQSVNPNRAPTYQLYLKTSDDGGRSWSDARIVSDFPPEDAGASYLDYDNQRPFIEPVNGELGLVWERQTGARARQIYYAAVSANGEFAGRPEAVSQGLDNSNYPQIVRHNGETFVMWFTNPFGRSQIQIASRVRGLWRSRSLSNVVGASTFGSPIVHRDRLHVFWQNRRGDGTPSLVYLEPDQRAQPPDLRAANYVPGRRSSRERAEFSWSPPEDPSGIAGYSARWTRNPEAFVPRRVEYEPTTQSASFLAEEDGEWYLRIRAVDRAGNWSEPTSLRFFRDTTPPPPITFEEPSTDNAGFLTSNTFTLRWQPPEEAEDVAGYSVTLRRLGAAGAEAPEQLNVSAQLPRRVDTSTPAISRNNIDNGLWALSVAPVDTVGNVGEARTQFLRLNKYIPVTEVYRIASSRDMLNRYNLSIEGRGFTANGVIDRIILDADGEEPYDHVFNRTEGDFRIVDNRNIEGPRIDIIDTGSYRVILSHTGRGLHTVARRLSFDAPGTVTFGDFRIASSPSFAVRDGAAWQFDGWEPLMWVAATLLGLLALFSGTRLVGIAQEGRELELEVKALIESQPMPREQKQRRLEAMSRKRTSLRLKFSVFVVVLIVSVILALALILGNTALERQERTLARGLEQRVQVLLDSVTNQAEDLLTSPADNRVDLATLAQQADVMAEGLYITITGPARDGAGFGAVWATSDPVLASEAEASGMVPRNLDTESFVPGESRLQDPVAELRDELEEQINEEARTRLGDIPAQLAEVRRELTNLLRQGVAPDDPELLDLDNTQRQLQQRQSQILQEVGSIFRSVPAFEPEELSTDITEYVFYQPVVFARAQEDPETARYFRGLVRLGISTDLILEEIDTARRQLIISTAIVALGALAGGIGGALLLATIVVIPIRRLVEGVAVIRDTEQKEKLENHVIDVRTRDELSELAEAVNSMTQGLVKAAKANKDLTVGKEVQKKFIPLMEDSERRKLTMAREETPQAEFAGYYEGAKGVSGDYFRYQKLDDQHYAVIKCDISGKGVPAALIMVQVATLFTNYFQDWTLKRKGLALAGFVTQINDIIASIGFEGRFAAFTAGILNIETGSVRLCNAGDTKIHLYDQASRKAVERDLPRAPAAGVFSSDMNPGGFPENDLVLHSGDIMLLFTDGIEESKRGLRTENYAHMVLSDEDIKRERTPEWLEPLLEDKSVTRKVSGELDEELGIPRIHEIVTAFQNRRRYRLEKVADPDGDEELLFDFSDAGESLEELVLALVSVEKIFRMYRPNDVTQDDRVQVDVRIDDFLRKHFRQYDRFFRYPLDSGDDSQYRYYGRVREEEQYDDLTILTIRKR